MNKNKGFTLIEIMIAVAIAGILVAIAIPAYEEHTGKNKRLDYVIANVNTYFANRTDLMYHSQPLCGSIPNNNTHVSCSVSAMERATEQKVNITLYCPLKDDGSGTSNCAQ